MVKRCSVCNHPSRPEIDRGLLAAVPYRTLAGQFGLTLGPLPTPQASRPSFLTFPRSPLVV